MHKYQIVPNEKVALILFFVLWISQFTLPIVTHVNAAPADVRIDSIYPSEGAIGTLVEVNGEIQTQNGSYYILFDGKEVKNGAASGITINDTFRIPLTAQGNHTVMLGDVGSGNQSLPVVFRVITSYSIIADPARLVEGTSTTLSVVIDRAEANVTYPFILNVTDPQPYSEGYSRLLLVTTDPSGSGWNSTVYSEDFDGAHTNFVGNYHVTLEGAWGLLTEEYFSVGLTDSVEYRLTTSMLIGGAGYGDREIVTLHITHVETGTSLLVDNRSAIGGIINLEWVIPESAMLGTYTVSLSNSTSSGTVKPVPDVQNFTVIDILVHCQTLNMYDHTALPGVLIKIFHDDTVIETSSTNATGEASFALDRGNYTFQAFWENQPVGNVTHNITNVAIDNIVYESVVIMCSLAHIDIALQYASDSSQDLSYILVTLTSNKTGTLTYQTNSTGTISLNTFTDTDYLIEAYRYHLLLGNVLIENLTQSGLINLSIPICSLEVYVYDSKGLPLPNVYVELFEWTSRRICGKNVTNTNGLVQFSCAAGKYQFTVSNYSQELANPIIFERANVDLIENTLINLTITLANLQLEVVIVDYFGQPIPNAQVGLEREFGQDYSVVTNLTTDSNGRILLPKVGGTYRLSTYLNGELAKRSNLRLVNPGACIIKLDNIVVLGGLVTKTTQFLTILSVTILVGALAIIFLLRRHRSINL